MQKQIASESQVRNYNNLHHIIAWDIILVTLQTRSGKHWPSQSPGYAGNPAPVRFSCHLEKKEGMIHAQDTIRVAI